MNRLTEICTGDWEDQFGNIKKSSCKQNQHQPKSGTTHAIRTFFLMSSGNLLGVLFWKLPIERKDQISWMKITDLT